MTRFTGGILWGLLAGVLFRCLECDSQVSVLCVCEPCVWLVYGETGLTLCNKSDNCKFSLCLFFFFFFFPSEQAERPGKRKVITKVQKGEASSLSIPHLNHYLNWVIYLFLLNLNSS